MSNNQSKIINTQISKPPKLSQYDFVVEAKSIDNKHIKFDCPYCFNKYKKNGQPYKRTRNRVHTHGSNGLLHNRIESRVHHHDYMRNKQGAEVGIFITDNTIRI